MPTTPKRPEELRVCEECGADYRPNRKSQRLCGASCVIARAQRFRWQSATNRYVGKDNIVMIYDPNTQSTRAEHRIVYEQSRGVKLQTWHHITWLDGNTLNNDPSNLVLRDPALEKYVQETGTLPAEFGRTICTRCHTLKTRKVTTPAGTIRWNCVTCQNERNRAGYHRRKNK